MTTDTNHPLAGPASAAFLLGGNDHKSPLPTSGLHHAPVYHAENWERLSGVRQHAAAWQAALQSEQTILSGQTEKMQLQVRAWAIALSLASARGLLGLAGRMIPLRLRGKLPPSIHLLDTRGPQPALARQAEQQRQLSLAQQSRATAAGSGENYDLLGGETDYSSGLL